MVVFGILCVSGLELAARQFGLGDVLLYESHPIYGYRVQPNQSIHRFGNAHIKMNNLGLRASQDWDLHSPNHKILFLGDSVTYGGSYIDNQDLFSEVAVRDTHFQAGNAGVNGWGILNIHGLVNELCFMPSLTYVTLVPEGDFYRGLNRFGGQPYWSKKARFALEELFFYGLYKLSLKKSPGFSFAALPIHEQEILVDIAVKHLKEMNDHLEAQGFKHIFMISPSRTQAMKQATIDPIIQKSLAKYDIKTHYLLDNFKDYGGDVDKLFHDEIHLTKEGHQQWGLWIKPLLEA